MKKVRSILILLLAVLTLAVFVACDPNPSTNNGAGTVEDTKVGDLIISKVYISGYDERVFGITNISDHDVDLTDYSFASWHSEEDTRVKNLPKTVIAPGVTVYVPNFDYDTESVPAFETLPEIGRLPQPNYKGPYQDKYTYDFSWTGVSSGIYNKGTMELVKNVKKTGEVTKGEGADKETFNIYTWDTVDKVLINGMNPGNDACAIRVYDPETKEDNGWQTVEVSEFDLPVDLTMWTFDKYLEDIFSKYPNVPKESDHYPVWAKMPEEALTQFQIDAGENYEVKVGQDVNGNRQIDVGDKNGHSITALAWGGYFNHDYSFETFKNEYQKNINNLNGISMYPRYSSMPAFYVETFVKAATTGEAPLFKSVEVDPETNTTVFTLKEGVTLTQRDVLNDKDKLVPAWKYEDTVTDFTFETFKPIYETIVAGGDSYDFSTLTTARYTTMTAEQLKAFNDALLVAYPDTTKENQAHMEEGKFYVLGYAQDAEGKWDFAVAPTAKLERNVPDAGLKVKEGQELIINAANFKKTDGYARWISVKNITDHEIDLSQYTIYSEMNALKTGAASKPKTVTFADGTKLAAGASFVVYNNEPSYLGDTWNLLPENQKLASKNFAPNGNDFVYLKKGDVIIEAPMFDNVGVKREDITETKSPDAIVGCVQGDLMYMRNTDADGNVSWDVYASTDKQAIKLLNDVFAPKAK